MNKTELRKKLNQAYDQQEWKDVVEFVFPHFAEFSGDQNLPIEPKDKDIVESFKQLGQVRLVDGKNLALFELKLKEKVNIIRNRVKLNDIVSSYIDQEQFHGVLSIFEQGKADYRFTFAAKASQFDEDAGDFINKKTDTKRFTYVLGKNESCRTAAERFYDLSEIKDKADIDAIEKAFSVETLSKNFFEEYKTHYNMFVDYLAQTPGYYTAIFNNDDKAIRDFVKLLLGRLVFIKFVQKKGWLGVPASEQGWENGNYRFIEHSFENFEHKDNFYSQFLNPLFFEGFDQPDRSNDVFADTNYKIPFLSGGLFDNEDPKTKTVNFPKAHFASLFDFFERYNFTIDENDTSMDREVGIDPEMLGHIFENLLEDNKDKGAFYTPKEIVRYMCQESLKEYLKTYLQAQNQWSQDEAKQKELEDALHKFVTLKEASEVIDFDDTLAKALKVVKICDPAIGSGAFPMGLLNEIFYLVHKLYEASPDKVGPIWNMNTWRPDTVKLNIIQQSIYGVDIEKGAVDIARLRFWLSLVVDSKEPHALPHLDYKIVVGDSLVSKLEDTIINIDWEATDDNAQTDLWGNTYVEQRKELLEQITRKQKQIFDPDCDDETISLEIRNLKIDLLINQLELMVKTQGLEEKPKRADKNLKKQTELWLQTKGWKQQIEKLKKMKKGDKTPLDFFDWKLDFPEVMNEQVADNIGFDIVIGNPPYIDSEKMVKEMPVIREILKKSYLTAKGNWDMFVPFTEKAINLNRPNGIFSFIIPNKILGAKYSLDLRKYIAKYNIIELRDYSSINVFKEADVYPITMVIKKECEKGNPLMASMKTERIIDKTYSIKQEIFYENTFWDKYFFSKIEVDLILKILSFDKLFNDKLKIESSATVGEAYTIKEFVYEHVTNSSGYKKLINTGTIDPFSSQWDQQKTTYIKNRYFKPIISNQDISSMSLKRLEQSNSPKIIVAGMSSKIEAYLDLNGEYYAGKSTSIICDNIVKLKIITGILNSRLSSFLVFKNFHTLKMAGGYLNINRNTLSILRRPENIFENVKFLKIINSCIKNKVTSYELDNLVYKLYNLTYAEVLIIEPEFSERMCEEDYEALEVE